MAQNPFRGRFTTETERERRLEIQREQRRRKSRRQESTGRRTLFTGNSLASRQQDTNRRLEYYRREILEHTQRSLNLA